MTKHTVTSRREFVQLAGFAAGAIGLGQVATGSAAETPAVDRSPDAVLARLIAGNRRFASGRVAQLRRRTPADFAADAEGQAPMAAIVACADSRVAPELIFDQGVGDLFVVRAAGNIVSGTGPLLKGSLEFGTGVLGCSLIMVLGHSHCGAVEAAIAKAASGEPLPGSIDGLIDLIIPSVEKSKGMPGDPLVNATRANVQRCVGTLRGLDPIISELVKAGKVKVVGGVYELGTGLVELCA
jgi:carbonic anhydrase